jgi:hypothetical protein
MESNFKLILLFAIFIAIIYYTKIENFIAKKKPRLNKPIINQAVLKNDKKLKALVNPIPRSAHDAKRKDRIRRAVPKGKSIKPPSNLFVPSKSKEMFSEISNYSEESFTDTSILF